MGEIFQIIIILGILYTLICALFNLILIRLLIPIKLPKFKKYKNKKSPIYKLKQSEWNRENYHIKKYQFQYNNHHYFLNMIFYQNVKIH